MFKQYISHYFKSFKYVAIPIATLGIAFIIGLSIIVPGYYRAVKGLFDEVQQLMEVDTYDWSTAQGQICVAAENVDWDNPLKAIKTIFSSDWMSSTLKSVVKDVFHANFSYDLQINEYVKSTVRTLTNYRSVFILIILAGFIIGQMSTRSLVRKKIAKAKRNIIKMGIDKAFSAIFDVTFIALAIWALSIVNAASLITAIVTWLLSDTVKLVIAYIIHGFRRIKLKKVFNFKNWLLMIISEITVFIIDSLIIYAVLFITNWMVCLFVGVIVFEMAFIVKGLEAESYVVKLVSEETPDNTIEPPDDSEGGEDGGTEANDKLNDNKTNKKIKLKRS